VRLSRITYFEGLVIGLIDGLPDLYFPLTVEGTGSGTGNSIYPTHVIRVVVGFAMSYDLAPPRSSEACHRARGRQGQAFGGAEEAPSLTAARHDGARNLRSGRKNGSAGVEQKNEPQSNFDASFL
jgi:hypothetical protein